MQQSPIERTLRYVIFSIGFVLFITMAFRAAHQATDPRYIKGVPFLFGSPPVSADALGSRVAASQSAVTLAAVETAVPSGADAAAARPKADMAVNATSEHTPVPGQKNIARDSAKSSERPHARLHVKE